MADALSAERAFQQRVDDVDEWLRTIGHSNVADLLRDLLAEHARLRHRVTAAQHRASAEYEQRIEVQDRLYLFKHQLSVQEARTGSWHQAYDAIHARLKETFLEIEAAITCLMDMNPPFNSLPWEAMRRLHHTIKKITSALPAAPET